MVITAELENYTVKKVFIDQGSLVDILYWTTYQKLQLPTTAMVPYDEPIYGFSGEKVSTRGYIDLYTIFRDGSQTNTISIHFLVVDAPTSYNVLLGRPSLNTLGAVISIPHLAMKFPSPSGDILTIHENQRLARECFMASLRPQLPILQTNHIERPPDFDIALFGDDLDPRVGRDARLEPINETIQLELPRGRTLKLGTGLQHDQREMLTPTLISNTDLFAWSLLTYLASTLKSQSTNSPFTKKPGMSLRKNVNLVKNTGLHQRSKPTSYSMQVSSKKPTTPPGSPM